MSKAQTVRDLAPGTFVPFEGGPVQQFERESRSPFDDGYSMDREREAVLHLIEADDPDPTDPMWWRFAEYQDREARLRQLQAEYKAMNAAPRSVTQREANNMSDMGALVDEADDQMTLHTKEGYRLFLGRRNDPSGKLPAIPGGRQLASALRSLWTRSSRDNPYADWGLLLADQYVSSLKADMRNEADELKGRLDAMAERGLKLSVLRSRDPKAVELGFKSPYGYAVAQLIIEYDYLVRIVKTLIRKDLLTDDDGRARIRNFTRRFRADCLKVFRFERFLVAKPLFDLSRRDFVPGIDDPEAAKRVAAVMEYFGPVPQEVFTGAVVPRHSRRRVSLTSDDRKLLETVAASLDDEADEPNGKDDGADANEDLL